MSAIFFLLFFSFFKPSDATDMTAAKPLTAKQRADYLVSLQNRLKKDTANKLVLEKIELFSDKVRPVTTNDTIKNTGGVRINFSNKDYRTFEEYDSTEKTLPPSKRDGWIGRRFVKLDINLTTKFRENPKEAANKLIEGFLHRLPYMLFVSLPLFALILRLVYNSAWAPATTSAKAHRIPLSE